MNISQRDKVLLLFLPGGLLLLGYLLFLQLPQQNVLAKTWQDLETARKKSPEVDQQLRARLLKQALLNQEIDKLHAEQIYLEAHWQSLTGSPRPERHATEKIERLTDLLVRNGLTVIEAGAAEKEGKMPPGLETVAKRLAEKKGGGRPAQWRIRISGSYLNVLGVLQQIAEGEPLAIPLSLTMTTGDGDNGYREWVLFFWI